MHMSSCLTHDPRWIWLCGFCYKTYSPIPLVLIPHLHQVLDKTHWDPAMNCHRSPRGVYLPHICPWSSKWVAPLLPMPSDSSLSGWIPHLSRYIALFATSYMAYLTIVIEATNNVQHPGFECRCCYWLTVWLGRHFSVRYSKYKVVCSLQIVLQKLAWDWLVWVPAILYPWSHLALGIRVTLLKRKLRMMVLTSLPQHQI